MLNTAPQIQYSAILDFIYPVGSYFITESANYDTVEKVQAHFGGTWVQLDAGRFLEAVTSGAGSNKDAGLPNITGTFTARGNDYNAQSSSPDLKPTGVFSRKRLVAYNSGSGKENNIGQQITFDASLPQNSLYGKSTTVQPKSRTVYMYRRTA